jgi:hypothetical protein
MTRFHVPVRCSILAATLTLSASFGLSAAAGAAAMAGSPSTTSPAALTAAVTAADARIAALPAPYSSWNVQLQVDNTQPGALSLFYDSPLLRQRTESTVYLPTGYDPAGAASAVMYFLHGTVVPSLDAPLTSPITGLESLLHQVGAGGGAIQTALEDFPSAEGAAHFIVVAPDTAPDHSWCETCVWINGRPGALTVPPVTARTVPAEDVLNNEIIPLVQAILNARADRGGRGIFGFSMGAVGAELQGFRHPDMYSYVGALSGPWDPVHDPFWSVWTNAVGYYRDQGYGTSITNPTMWLSFDPAELAPNLVGSGDHLLVSAGDGCLTLADLLNPPADCQATPPLTNPAAATVETQMRRSNDQAIPQLGGLGLSPQEVRSPGVHGANNHLIYADYIVASANAVFASSVATTSPTFSYETGDTGYSIWGYRVVNARSSYAITRMTDVARNGSAFTVSGSGTETVTTPAEFAPGSAHAVTVSAGPTTVSKTTVMASSYGQLTVSVDLNSAPFSSTMTATVTIG